MPTNCHRPFAPQVDVIIGGQYGSEGKGMICGHLASEYDVAIRVGAPNAGHTLKVGDKVWKMQQIPVMGLINTDCVLIIGAAGLINLDILKREMEYIKDIDGRFFIDRNAGILEHKHKEQEEQEAMFKGIGSTMEGVGAALRDKVKRDKSFKTAKDIPELAPYIINAARYINSMPSEKRIMIEGTQGFSLSLNHGPYPYCTSRDILASSLLSDVGISPRMCGEIIMLVRSYPIRVAGNSGPLKDEIDWATVTKEAGYPHELIEKTTVTKRVRRVGRFDIDQVIEACLLNRPTQIALTFADYVTYEDAHKTEYDDLSVKTKMLVQLIEDKTSVPVTLIQTGPEHEDICDRR